MIFAVKSCCKDMGKLKLCFLLSFIPFMYFKAASQEMHEGIVVSCPIGEHSFTQVNLGHDLSNLRTAANTASFDVTYGSGFPSGAKTAFQAAVNVWSKVLVSRVPIKISAKWEEVESNTLASSGAKNVYKNFSNSAVKNVWYPVSLAEAIKGENLNGTDFDITISINKNINWSYLTDGNYEAFKYDLMTVVMHEIAHGLGFTSTFKLNETNTSQAIWGLNGLPIIYDIFLQNSSGILLTNDGTYGNPSTDLKKFLTSNALYFKITNESDLQDLPKIFAPTTYVTGGSISHLDESKYPKGTINSLMSPSIGSSEVNHFPGEVILKVLNQIGWPVNFLSGAVVTSVEPPANNEKFFVFPNPVNDILNVIVPEKFISESFYFQVFDGSGVLQKNVLNSGEDSQKIDFSDFAPGLYYIKTGDLQSFRIIKN